MYQNIILPYIDSSLPDAYLHLLVAFTSANPVFLTGVIKQLWTLLQDRTFGGGRGEWKDLVEYNYNDGEQKEEGEEKKEDRMHVLDMQRAQRIHATLATILRLCPRGNTEIFSILASGFPFKLTSLDDQVWYAKQCLSVLRYVPTIQGAVLGLLLDKALEIDVEIKVEEGGGVAIEIDDEEDEEDEMAGLFELEMGDDKKAKKENSVVEDVKVDDMADKLDSIMLLVFQHLSACCKNDVTAPKRLYKIMSPVFDSNILTTHRCKFVQFVMFVICGFDNDISAIHHNNNHIATSDSHDNDDGEHHQSKLYREFAAKLIDIVLDPYRATVTRQSAACYLASFMSRASYVCPETICESVSAMLRWAEAYMDTFPKPRMSSANDTNSGISSSRPRNGMNNMREQCEMHSLFYTVCQAAYYTMCFRGVEATQYFNTCVEYYSQHNINEDDDEDIPYAHPNDIDISAQRWMKVCGHHLQPLKHCLESVRHEFLHLASVFGLLDENLLQHLVLEDQKMASGLSKMRQRKARLISTPATLEKERMKGGVGGLGRGSNPLDSFFPFDPYLLRRSHPFVEPFYKHWEGSADEEDLMHLEADETMKEEEEVYESDGSDESHTDDSDDDSDDDEEHAQHMHGTPEISKMSFTSSCSALVTIGRENEEEEVGDGCEGLSSVATSLNDSLASVGMVSNDVWAQELKRSRAQSIGSECW